MPLSSSTVRASSTVCAVGLELPGHAALEVDAEVEALKINDMALTTMSTPEMMKPMRRLPTKSKLVSPW